MNVSSGNESNQTTPGAESLLYNCTTPHLVADWDEFFYCYSYFFLETPLNSICQLIIIAGSVIFNFLLIGLTVCNGGKRTAFDDILIGHAFVDGLTGVVDIPFFHINDRFGYWPFWPILSQLWLTYDSNINITTTLHMLYASYARWRSMKNPQGYKFELLLKRPYWVMAGFWVFGISVWAPIAFACGVVENVLAINMSVYFNASVNFATWCLPLIIVLVICVFIYVDLVRIVNRTKNMLAKNLSIWRKYRIGAQLRFIIIMATYWIQWSVPCFINVSAPFVSGIPAIDLENIYWLTYSVCMTDPIFVLILNTNINWSKKKANYKK